MRNLRTALVVALFGLCGCGTKESPLVKSSLECWLEAPSRVHMGEKVSLSLHVKNSLSRKLDIGIGGSPSQHFSVADVEGREVWTWLHNEARQDILEMKTLDPNEEMVFTGEWMQNDNDGKSVSSGKYFIRGMLTTEPPLHVKAESVSIEIVP